MAVKVLWFIWDTVIVASCTIALICSLLVVYGALAFLGIIRFVVRHALLAIVRPIRYLR